MYYKLVGPLESYQVAVHYTPLAKTVRAYTLHPATVQTWSFPPKLPLPLQLQLENLHHDIIGVYWAEGIDST